MSSFRNQGALWRPRSQPPAPPVAPAAPAVSGVKLEAARGRIYVIGPDAQRLKRLPGATWNERRGALEVSLTLETVRRMAAVLNLTTDQLLAHATPSLGRWVVAALGIEAKLVALHAKLGTGWRAPLPWRDAEEGLRPFQHQEVMATVAVELDGAALLCDVGTGKTRAGAEAAREMMQRGVIDTVIVVSPRGVMGTWAGQLARWTPDMRVVRLDGTIAERRAVLTQLPREGPMAVLTNYDALDRLQDVLVPFMRDRKAGLLCDEMHRVKNPQALTTKALLTMVPYARWRVGMTATPLANGVEDVWSQWFLVDLGVTFGGNFTQYRREFFSYNVHTGKWDADQQAQADIALRMQRRAVRYRQDECLDLPPVTYQEYEVEMSAEQARVYREMSRDYMARFGDEPTVATAMTEAMRLQRLAQICSGWVTMEDGTERRIDGSNPKLAAVVDLVRENIATRQMIVWAFYRKDHDLLMEALAEFQPALIRGGVKFEEREAIERRLNAGEVRLLVAAPGAAGVGLNLQAASLAIYYSNWYSLIDREQSEGRIRRAGSERHDKITYIDLILKGTIDRAVLRSLRRKKTLLDFVRDVRETLVA